MAHLGTVNMWVLSDLKWLVAPSYLDLSKELVCASASYSINIDWICMIHKSIPTENLFANGSKFSNGITATYLI